MSKTPGLKMDVVYENYEIYLRGSGYVSNEGDNNYLKIANVSMPMTTRRGLNTVILNPNGTYKTGIYHDAHDVSSVWNDWADWINDTNNVANGDVVALASRDSISSVPSDGSAKTLLRSINALKAFVSCGHRTPYALLFIKGKTGAIEVFQPSDGLNAHLKTTYYELFNYGDYALLQGSNGYTILNAAADQGIRFNIGGQRKITLDSGGKLGIGTTSPEEKLHIKDGSLRIDNGQIKSLGTITFQPNTDQSAGEDLIKFLDKNANSVATIKDDGKLELTGELLYLASDGAGIKLNGDARIYKKIGSGLKIKPHNDDHGIEFLKADNSTTQMILKNGNVGVGTTSPKQKLDVNGWMSISGSGGLKFYKSDNDSQYWNVYPEWSDSNDPDLFFDYSSNSSGWVSGWLEPYGGWRNHSDQSLKQDMEPMSNILEKVIQLQPKSFRWINSEPDSLKYWGFIAQEVEAVFPDRISTRHGLKGLNYSDFGVLAIAAIQEQQKLIDALQEEVAQLKQ